LAIFGSSTLSKIQDSLGASLYFNPYITLGDYQIKYGVISMEKLLSDLNEWDNLYVAGRMQKPIHVLRTDPRVKLGLEKNRYNATRLSFVYLKELISS
jgi:translocator assembly and maintenance protein 41